MNDPNTPARPMAETPAWRGWAVMAAALVATFLLGLLAASILQRREEARLQTLHEPIAEPVTDPARWRDNYPRQYATYRAMIDDTTRTVYGGAFPRDYLEETPANKVLFAGYGFAKEYRQARGHVWAIEDVVSTARVGPTTPATCWTCKSPEVMPLMEELGGPAKFYATAFHELKQRIMHPIGCYDCHDPTTMRLVVTRPALREAFERQGRDLDQATHQEMRSLVCAQCHVEYYFKGEGRYLTFPWDKGTTVEQMEAYYAEAGFSDWNHAVSKARMVKIQHPDYEVYLTGIHAYRGVACADCHMPYRTEGGAKFTNHQIQSPLLDVANSCAVCHRWSEQEIRDRVVSIQNKVHEGRQRAEKALVKAHYDIAAAAAAGAPEDELASVRQMVSRAQLRWDYVAAANGMGVHSPQECLRILASAVDLAGECRVECARILARHGATAAPEYPDIRPASQPAP